MAFAILAAPVVVVFTIVLSVEATFMLVKPGQKVRVGKFPPEHPEKGPAFLLPEMEDTCGCEGEVETVEIREDGLIQYDVRLSHDRKWLYLADWLEGDMPAGERELLRRILERTVEVLSPYSDLPGADEVLDDAVFALNLPMDR